MNVYHANAVALGGNVIRPFEQTLESQADSSLSSGRGSKHVENFNFEGVLSFRHAYSEVNSSFDECHNVYTTYSHAVIEGLDVAGVVFADRIVSRLVVQSPVGPNASQHSFDLTGSHFENLRIAGHKIDVPLATYRFHQYDTYAKLERAFQDGTAQDLLPWGILGDKQLENLEKQEEEFAGISGMGMLVRQWRQQKNLLFEDGTLWCSAAAHLNLSEQLGQSELQAFGSIILIPKFGSINLAELQIQKQSRQLIMIRVRLSSPMDGNFQAGRTEVTGSRHLLPEPLSKGRSTRESPQPIESVTEIDHRIELRANHGLVEYPDRQHKMQAILRPNCHYTYWFEITAKSPPGADSEPFIEPAELNQPDGVVVQVQITSSMLDGSSFASRNVLYQPGVGLVRQEFGLTTRIGDRSLVIQVVYNGHPVYSKKWQLRCFRPNANDQAPSLVVTAPLDIAPMPATSRGCRLVDDDDYVKRVSLEVPDQRPFMSAKDPNSETLVIAAAAARRKLNEFARGNAPEAEGSLEWTVTWEMLRSMAIWGHESAEEIFGKEATSLPFYQALKGLPLGSRLHIDSHPGSFPWQWIYVGEIPGPTPLDIKSRALHEFLCGFFGYRFRCDILPSADVERLGVARVLANLRGTHVLNFLNDTADLEASPQHVEFVEGMAQQYPLIFAVYKGGPATVDALQEAVAEASDPTHLINFYCHHSPGIELSEHGFYNFGESTLYMKGKQDEAITRKQLKYDIQLSSFKKGAPVVLLNACGTALGESYFPNGFMPYFTNELKVPAVIGTVAEVPTLAAHQFAREFIPLLLSGDSVHDAMSRLRHDWLFNRGNPYVLFYTVYGNGSVHLEKSLEEVEA